MLIYATEQISSICLMHYATEKKVTLLMATLKPLLMECLWDRLFYIIYNSNNMLETWEAKRGVQ